MELAQKMYHQASKGGKGSKPKYNMVGKEHSMKDRSMAGHEKSIKTRQSIEGNFSGKYHQADGKRKESMIGGHSKSSQKGRQSLSSHGKNMGEKMYLGKNEHNRA